MQPPISPAAMSERQKTLAFWTLLIAMVLEILDVTIINVAMPAIEAGLGTSPAQAQWIATGYSLSFALFLLVGGRLGDVLGYRRMFIGGVAGFTTASLLCGLAMDQNQLIAARVLQGVTGAVMAPQVMALVQMMYAPLERVSKLAWFGLVGGLAAIAGPILGGALISWNLFDLGWRTVFLINGPVGLLAIAAAWRLLPRGHTHPESRIDLVGTLIFGAALALFLMPLVQGAQIRWGMEQTSQWMASAALLYAGWLRQGQRHALALPVTFSPELMSIGQFRTGLMIAATFGAASSGFLFVFAFSLQQELGRTALQTGMLHVPFSLGVMAGIAFLGRRYLARLGKWLLVAGASLMALGLLGIMGWVAGGGRGWGVYPVLLLAGLGMGMLTGPVPPLTLARIPLHLAGVASGMLKTIQQMGLAIGVALAGSAYFAGRASQGLHPIWLPTILIVILLAGSVLLALRLPERLFPDTPRPSPAS